MLRQRKRARQSPPDPRKRLRSLETLVLTLFTSRIFRFFSRRAGKRQVYVEEENSTDRPQPGWLAGLPAH